MEKVTGEPLLTGEPLNNEIIRFFKQCILEAGYNPEGTERNKIPTNFYRSIFRRIQKEVFTPNNVNTLNPDTLQSITEVYIYLCTEYSIASMLCFYADYIGVDAETIKRWCEGDTRTAIYRDSNTGAIINNEQYKAFYLVKYPDAKLERVASPVYCETAKKIKQLRQDIVISKSLDFQNGVLMDLNNGRETGTEYNQKRAIESATAQAVLSVADLPKLNCIDN